MGSIVSGVTGALGLTNSVKSVGGNGAAEKAEIKKLSAEQITLAKDQLAFNKEQYSDWKAIYGDIEENLGNYYKNLSSDTLIATGLQKQQEEFQAARQALQKDFAQRGITGSGADVQATTIGQFQNAEARARIRTAAPAAVAAEKLSFLNTGLSQQAALLGGISNAASDLNSAYGGTINAYAGIAAQAGANAVGQNKNNSNAMGDLIGIGLGFL